MKSRLLVVLVCFISCSRNNNSHNGNASDSVFIRDTISLYEPYSAIVRGFDSITEERVLREDSLKEYLRLKKENDKIRNKIRENGKWVNFPLADSMEKLLKVKTIK